MNNRPRPAIVDAIGQPVQQQQPDVIRGMLWPLYLSVIPAVAGRDEHQIPSRVADEAMAMAIAGLAKLGIQIVEKPSTPESETP